MNISELKLRKYAHYKAKDKSASKHYLFCIVYDKEDGEIFDIFQSVPKENFDLKLLLKNRDTSKNKIKKQVEFFYFPVSNSKKILSDFRVLKKIWFDVGKKLQHEDFTSIAFKKVKSIIKKYYTSFSIVALSIYSAYFYYALKDIGIPISTLNVSSQELLSIIFFSFFAPVLILLGLVISIFSVYIIIPVVFKFFAIFILFHKKPTIYFYMYDIGYVPSLISMCINLIIFIIVCVYLIFISIPFAHFVVDKMKFGAFRKDIFKPSYLYYEYLQDTGFPRAAELNGTNYIFVGYDKSYEHMYDLNLSKNYLFDRKSTENNNSYEQFCRNIADDNSSGNFIYEFLRNSPEISGEKVKLFKIKNSSFKYKRLGNIFKKNEKEKIDKNCKVYLKNK